MVQTPFQHSKVLQTNSGHEFYHSILNSNLKSRGIYTKAHSQYINKMSSQKEKLGTFEN